jgi:hypothetical protein
MSSGGSKGQRARTSGRIYRCPPQNGGCSLMIGADALEGWVDEHVAALLSDQATVDAVGTVDQGHAQAYAEAEARLASLAAQTVVARREAIEAAAGLIAPVNPGDVDRLNRLWVAARDDVEALALKAAGPPVPVIALADCTDGPAEAKRGILSVLRVGIDVNRPLPGAPRNRVDRRRVVLTPVLDK